MSRLALKFLLFLTLIPGPGLGLRAADWPHWRGPLRDGTTSESSGWEEGAWPPEDAWSASVGTGSASVLVADGKVYAFGNTGDRESVVCLDAATGGVLWEEGYPAPDYGRHAVGDKNFYRGPSATPELDPETGRLYTLGIDGDLRCWDTTGGGKVVWALNLYDAYGIPRRPQVTPLAGSHRDYGHATSPLVHGSLLLVGAGDPERGNVLAFDKDSGKLVWGSEGRDAGGHAGGLVPTTIAGKPCVVSLTATRVLVTEIGRGGGRSIGAYPWATDFLNNIATPAVLGDGSILVTSNYNLSATAALAPGGGMLRRVWQSGESSGVCSPVVDGPFVYLGGKGLRCLDAGDGRVRWSGGNFGAACSLILTGDQRLVVWANDGDLALVEGAGRSPDAFTPLAERKGVLRDMAWPHIVLADGRLFCKDRSGNLKCLAIGKRARELAAHAEPLPVAPLAADGFDLADWPADGDAPVLAWKKGGGKRGFLGTLTRGARWSLVPADGAALAEDGSLAPNGRGFTITGDTEALSEAFRKSGSLTLEVVFTSADLDQGGPARLLTFSEGAFSRNLTLGQEKDALVLRLRTPATGQNGMAPESVLAPIKAGTPYHCLVSYGNGTLACYLNGAEVYRKAGHVSGDFSNWTPQHLLVGDEWGDPRPWKGIVEGFAFYAHSSDPDFAARQFRRIASRNTHPR